MITSSTAMSAAKTKRIRLSNDAFFGGEGDVGDIAFEPVSSVTAVAMGVPRF
jgi:hypothetical protein